jgi:hypothetical protein
VSFPQSVVFPVILSPKKTFYRARAARQPFVKSDQHCSQQPFVKSDQHCSQLAAEEI